jgi:transcriptional regulator with XRE-family HTH domain
MKTEALRRLKIERLADELGGQSEVARLLGVDRSRVSRWLTSGSGPDPENLAKLDALEFVMARLLQVFPPETARKWLTSVNAHLGNRRPADLVAANRIAEVVGAIEQADTGAYA